MVGATINITGFSCKDLSSYKAQRKDSRGSALRSGGGSSGLTFGALLDHLNLPGSTVRVWLGENVDDLAKMSSDNRAYLLERMAEGGWACDIRLLEASDFACSADRSRVWIIALHLARMGISMFKAACCYSRITNPTCP